MKSGGNQWSEAQNACIRSAGCAPNLDSFSEDQKQALGNKWDISVKDIGTQYEEVIKNTVEDLKKGAAAHEGRMADINIASGEAVKKFAISSGCKEDCMMNCHDTPNYCAKSCGCGDNWINVKPVNTAAIIEEHYGDVSQLTEEQLDEIDWALRQQEQIQRV